MFVLCAIWAKAAFSINSFFSKENSFICRQFCFSFGRFGHFIQMNLYSFVFSMTFSSDLFSFPNYNGLGSMAYFRNGINPNVVLSWRKENKESKPLSLKFVIENQLLLCYCLFLRLLQFLYDFFKKGNKLSN